MIPRFTDYAANERTYLAWVRTAIAIMAFGFVIERFDLFLHYLGAGQNVRMHGSRTAEATGLALIVVAVAVMLVATLRFLHHRRAIAAEERRDYGTPYGERLLTVLLICLGVFLLIYVAAQLYAQH